MKRIFWQFLIEIIIIIFLMVAFYKIQPQLNSKQREIKYTYSKSEREYAKNFLMDVDKLNEFDEVVSLTVKIMLIINFFLFLGILVEIIVKKIFAISIIDITKKIVITLKEICSFLIAFAKCIIDGALK